MALTRPDEDPQGERFVTLGRDALGRLLVVVYEWLDEDARLISARRASRSERRHYEGKREEELRLQQGAPRTRDSDPARQDPDYDSN